MNATTTGVLMDTATSTYGVKSWGMANPSPEAGDGYEIATMDSDPSHWSDGTRMDEFDVNVAAAFFPYNGEFQVRLPGRPVRPARPAAARQRRHSPRRRAPGDRHGQRRQLAIAGPTSDGTGWTVIHRDNAGTRERDDFGYVYMPYGTENLVAGLSAPTAVA